MKKTAFGNHKMTLAGLAALFIVSGSIAHATPSTQEAAFELMMEQFIASGKQEESPVCNDFPMCPSPFAPTEIPENEKG